MTIRDNRDFIRVVSYSYYTTMTGWGVLLRFNLYILAPLPVAIEELSQKKQMRPVSCHSIFRDDLFWGGRDLGPEGGLLQIFYIYIGNHNSTVIIIAIKIGIQIMMTIEEAGEKKKTDFSQPSKTLKEELCKNPNTLNTHELQ